MGIGGFGKGLIMGAGAAAGGVGSLVGLGAYAGSKPDKATSQTDYKSKNTQTQRNVTGVNLGRKSAFESYLERSQGNTYRGLEGLINQGPGQRDVTAGLGAQRDFASMLQQYTQSGGMPGQQDILNANNTTSQFFQPQRVQLQQSLQDLVKESNRRAGLTGRGPNDPMFMNKLAQERLRQEQLLGAQEQSYASQLALQTAENRIGYASQRAELLGGLASQAMANRQALLGMGQQSLGNERNWRLNTGRRYQDSSATSNQSGTQMGTQMSGGGLKGAVAGGTAALGTMTNLAGSFYGMGGGGGGAAAPQAPGYSGGYQSTPGYYG